jgi:hypothetical protein
MQAKDRRSRLCSRGAARARSRKRCEISFAQPAPLLYTDEKSRGRFFMSLGQSGSTWLRQTFAWSNSPSSWKDRLFLAAFAFYAVILAGLGFVAWLWQSPIGWTVLAILAAGFARSCSTT